MNLTSEGIWLLTSSSNGLQTNFGRLKRDSSYYKITENVVLEALKTLIKLKKLTIVEEKK